MSCRADSSPPTDQLAHAAAAARVRRIDSGRHDKEAAMNLEYEKCYVFQPDEPEPEPDHDSRPAKRRRIAFEPPPPSPQGLQASWNARRKQAYQQAWRARQSRIDETLGSMNAATVADIVAFLDDHAVPAAVAEEQQQQQQYVSEERRIPTGLILGGPDSALRTSSIAAQIESSQQQGGEEGGSEDRRVRRLFVSLSSAATGGANLKALLKTVIQQATTARAPLLLRDDADEDEAEEHGGGRTTSTGAKLLSYDLQALHDHVRARGIQQVVVAFEDTEAFDSDVLSELLELFVCWRARIPFACLFHLATSVDFLHQRLSRRAARCLAATLFDAALSAEEREAVFAALTSPDVALWLGPGLATALLDRQADHIQSIDSLVRAARYAYMSCYYANALSIFLDPDLPLAAVPLDHFDALRHLPSFQFYVEHCLDRGDRDQVHALLGSDPALFAFARQSVDAGRARIAAAIAATALVRTLQAGLPNVSVSSPSHLYVQAMHGSLARSPLLRSLLLSLKKAPSNVALQILDALLALPALPDALQQQVAELAAELRALLAQQQPHHHTAADSDSAADPPPLRSADDLLHHSATTTVRTTVVAHKVELNRHRAALSRPAAAYTALLRRLADGLHRHLLDTALPLRLDSLPLHEIFVYDLRAPYREVFTPRPRHALERALATPHDYLDCDCCAPTISIPATTTTTTNNNTDVQDVQETQEQEDEASLAASQPATAVLYQLYLESGSLINANDLWLAFQAVMGDGPPHGEEGEDGEGDEQPRRPAATIALFQRALAELRFLGLLRSTRKRVDHVAKVAWRGL